MNFKQRNESIYLRGYNHIMPTLNSTVAHAFIWRTLILGDEDPLFNEPGEAMSSNRWRRNTVSGEANATQIETSYGADQLLHLSNRPARNLKQAS
jgi:hypothetical protein